MIGELHKKGLSVAPTRVLEVSSQLCRMVVQRAKEENVVCPSILRKGIFTVAALDNLDFTSTSTTSVGEFHGTGISIFQCPLPDNQGQRRVFKTSFADVFKARNYSVPELPDSYALVPDCVLTSEKPNPTYLLDASQLSLFPEEGQFSLVWKQEESWLSSMRDHLRGSSDDECTNVSWSAFHAARENEVSHRWIDALLPLFHDKSATVSMIKHGMTVTKEITEHLNKDQVPVFCVDQPLFAIAKKIQWSWPSELGESKIVVMFGQLHIEQIILRLLGQYAEESGLTTITAHSGISTVGAAEAMLKVTHIKRARELHQVTAAVLHDLLIDQYEHEHPDGETSLEDWLQKISQESPTCYFWLTLLNLEVLLLAFVRSVREGNFDDYKESLKLITPWFFAFGHHHYARWLPVHIYDLEQLPYTAEGINDQFMKGRFVVHKTENRFSGIGIDHAHEQSNAFVKGSGGATGLTSDPSSLRRWSIGGPEVARILKEFGPTENDGKETLAGDHHDQNQAYQSRFFEQCIALKEAFLDYDNPFSVRASELITLDTRIPVAEEGVTALMSAQEKGLSMYTDFMNNRLVNKSQSFHDPIQKLGTHIFTSKKKSTKSSTLRMLKSDVNLFSRCFIVSVARDLDLDQFFAHENQNFPPSLSLNGQMRTGDKSQLVLILEKLISKENTDIFSESCDGLIIDGGLLVHNVKPRGDVTTFDGYAQQLFWHVSSVAQHLGVSRVDVVWDQYLAESLKSATRQNRGAGVRRIDLPNRGKLPSNWADYLRNDSNKEELLHFLAQFFVERKENFQIVTNVKSKIVASYPGDTSLHGMMCPQREEADERIILHLQDMVQHCGAQSVVIRSSDTDVVVLAVSFFADLEKLGLKELWIQYGSGAHRRYISVHAIYKALGRDKSIALRAFHAFTGCDVVSFFGSKGKRSAMAAWIDDETTQVFLKMSDPHCDPETLLIPLEKFVCRMYGIKGALDQSLGVNQARKDLFASESRHIAALPPTQGALMQHILRATYVAGQIWGQANVISDLDRPSPEGWGWTLVDGQWEVVWTLLPQIWEAVMALDRCGCRTGCDTQRCCCRRLSLPCSPACKICKGECCNKRENAVESLPNIFGDD